MEEKRRPHKILPASEPELLGVQAQRHRRRSRALSRPALLFSGLLVLGLITYSTCGEPEIDDSLPPIAAAPPGAPEDGGDTTSEPMTPGQESEAASRAGAALPAAPAEAAPEEPIPAVAAELAPEPAAAPTAPESVVSAPEPTAPVVAAVTAETAPVAEPEPAPAPPPAAAAKPAVSEIPLTPEARIALSGAFTVQLVSVRNPEDALRHWTELRAKHPHLLGELSPSVQRADLGAKGVYYRLRAGPFLHRASAASTCEALQLRGGACLVVRN